MSGRIVLASTSAIRRKILIDAGVDFDAVAPDVDESQLKHAFLDHGGEAVAAALAEAKALAVARTRPSDTVIGADQILRIGDIIYDKTSTRDGARDRLLRMRGRAHELVCGLALARGEEVLSKTVYVSRIHVRDFSDAFLDDYLDRAGDAILASVACYQFEGLGAQFFERVEGDYFAILGLPLVPLLNLLRAHGALAS